MSSNSNKRFIFLIVVVLIVALISFYNQGQRNAQISATYEELFSKATASLETFCEKSLRMLDLKCMEWANDVIYTDPERYKAILMCDKLYPPVEHGSAYADCLFEAQIDLPNANKR